MTAHFPPALTFFFLLVEISSRTPIPFFFFLVQDQSTVAQRTRTTVAEIARLIYRINKEFSHGQFSSLSVAPRLKKKTSQVGGISAELC